MGVWELLLIAVALSMDAFAAGLSDGMAEPAMPVLKRLSIAFAFGLFQFLMPVAGYYAGSVFTGIVEKIAPWLSFVLLGAIGGKAVLSYAIAQRSPRFGGNMRSGRKKLGAASLLAQALATSMDALAVGVALLAAEQSEGLPYAAVLCALLIGMVTFSLSAAAVLVGERVGNRYAERAELLGGFILLLIGIKLLLEGVL